MPTITPKPTEVNAPCMYDIQGNFVCEGYKALPVDSQRQPVVEGFCGCSGNRL